MPQGASSSVHPGAGTSSAGPTVEPLEAVIFDVDGTLADTERDGHRVAFNEAFAAAGLDFRWDVPEYGELLAVTGGRRRIAHFLRRHGYSAEQADALAADLHKDKTRRFAALAGSGALRPRPGVAELISELRAAGIRTAVATTGTGDWVHPLLDTLFGADAFEIVMTGTEVTDLKPDPAVYNETLSRLGIDPSAALAIEDSANGVRAAVGAGLRCVAVVNDYTRGQDLSGAVAVVDDVARPDGVRVLRGDPVLRRGLNVSTLRALAAATARPAGSG